MFPVKLAVISDLHIGKSARSKDLCPHTDSKAIDSDFKSKFTEFLGKNLITADYLVIPGDITDNADPNEFELASSFISDIAAKLKVPSDKIIIVPGNHDVNWALLQVNPSDKSGFYYGLRYAPLASADHIFDEILNRGSHNLLDSPHITIWEYGSAIIVGLNSSWHDNPDVSVHHGLVSNETITELEQVLNSLDLESPRLKIFVLHHHPVAYSDPIAHVPEFSMMTNSPNLLKLLQSKHFDLCIHGHKHVPHFESHSLSSGFPLAILAAGSLSAMLDTRWSGCVNNQFHLIHIKGRDSESKSAYGQVESWTYTSASDWTKSKSHNGIRHLVPFGTYLNPNILSKELELKISSSLATKTFVTWSDITKLNPNYCFLPPDLVINVLDKIKNNVGFDRHGTPPDEIVMTKHGAYDE